MARSISGKGFVGTWSGDDLIKNNDKALAAAAQEAAVLLVREARKLVSRPGPTKGHATGTEVGGETIRPSAPGEPPRKRTGNLRNSISHEKANESGTQVRVGTSERYGFWLELGTRRGLEPRPWLRPTLQKLRGKFQEIFIRHGKRGVDKG